MNAVDTNILVYAVSIDEPVRGPAALALIESLDPSATMVLWQVAVEFMAVMARLHRQGRTDSRGDAYLSGLRARFAFAMPTPEVFDRALAVESAHRTSWWDGLIIAACLESGVSLLYSEDLPGRVGGRIDTLRIVNPLPTPPAA